MSDVTVITAAFNAQQFLEQTIHSVAHQTYMPHKHLVIDDKSKDETLSLAQTLKQQYPHIEVIAHKENKGFPGTVNTGLENTTTKYVALLDSDDIAYPDWLEIAVSFLEENPEFGLVGGAGNYMTEKGEVTDYIGFNCEKGEVTARIRNGEYLILHPGTVMRLDCINKVGGYRSDLKSTEDNDMFINMAFVTRLYHFGRPLIYYRKLKSSESRVTTEFKKLISEYLTNKIDHLKSGFTIEQSDQKLRPIVKKMSAVQRLEPMKKGAYEQEIARIFFVKKKFLASLKYFLASVMRKVL